MDAKDLQVRCLHVNSEKEALDCLRGGWGDPSSIEYIVSKMGHVNILVETVECGVANILKQEMLSVGGDAAVAHDKAGCSGAKTDVILLGTLKQVRCLAENIRLRPFGLRDVAREIDLLSNRISSESHVFKTSRREINLGKRTLIMGILNVTPDSFSDGGKFAAPDEAVEAGIQMKEEGADIIDVGGESTRPGSDRVPPAEEVRRIVPVIRGLASRIDIPLSIDTTKELVARAALAEGAEIVNDISSMNFDEQMASLIAETRAATIFMHMRGTPKTMQNGDLSYRSLWSDVIAFLRGRIKLATEVGIDPLSIMVDPGLGFGKSAEDNLRLLHDLPELKVLGKPILTGPSRKSFIGRFIGGNPQQRIEGTSAAVTAAIMNGCHVIRVHDVGIMKKVAAMADALTRPYLATESE